jgi:2,3-bisphosphoglycerate-independent phosphoglycerate mutase
MKYILVIGDGMADNPVPELGGKTPLEYVKKPHIDAMAARGEVGNTLNVPRGLPAGSDTAILSIFGCDPNRYFTGRAPMEAAASGLRLRDGDAAYRCNMICLEDSDKPFAEKKILSHSAGSIEGDESIAIVTALWNDPGFRAAADRARMEIHPDASFRHIAVQSGADIRGIKLIPPHDHLGETIGQYLPSGCENARTLKELMELAHSVLDHHPLNESRRERGKMPANGIWFWAEGTAVTLPNFWENYHKKGGVISAVPLCHGIAALTGLDMIRVEGATGELETNYEGKVAAAVKCLEDGNDFVAIHIEAPDECTHNGDLKGKLQAIEWLDSRVVGPLAEELRKEPFEYRLLLLSDHKTLTSTRGHDGDPVPYLIYQSDRDTGFGGAYDEKTGMSGNTVPAGVALMDMLFETEKRK